MLFAVVELLVNYCYYTKHCDWSLLNEIAVVSIEKPVYGRPKMRHHLSQQFITDRFNVKTHVAAIYIVSQKRPPSYFSNNSQKLTDFNDFWCVKY